MEQNNEETKEEGLINSPEEMKRMYSVLKESIYSYISKVLADNAATEENPLECYISLEFGACGLSRLEMPCIESIFIDDEGIIWCKIDNNEGYTELDELYLDDQMDIVKNII